jgi:hypothetical protein
LKIKKNYLAEDEDHRSDNNSRLRLSSPLSVPSSALSTLTPSGSILKRSKTTSSSSMRQKSAVSFVSSRLNNNDSDTEQVVSSKRPPPKYKDFIRQLPIYLAKSILSMLDEKTLDKCKFVSLYWKKMALEVEDEATMTKMLYDDMMLLQVNFLKNFYYKIKHKKKIGENNRYCCISCKNINRIDTDFAPFFLLFHSITALFDIVFHFWIDLKDYLFCIFRVLLLYNVIHILHVIHLYLFQIYFELI